MVDYTPPFQALVRVLVGLGVAALVVRRLMLAKRERAAQKLANPGLAHGTLAEVVEELEEQAKLDLDLQSKLHEH